MKGGKCEKEMLQRDLLYKSTEEHSLISISRRRSKLPRYTAQLVSLFGEPKLLSTRACGERAFPPSLSYIFLEGGRPFLSSPTSWSRGFSDYLLDWIPYVPHFSLLDVALHDFGPSRRPLPSPSSLFPSVDLAPVLSRVTDSILGIPCGGSIPLSQVPLDRGLPSIVHVSGCFVWGGIAVK